MISYSKRVKICAIGGNEVRKKVLDEESREGQVSDNKSLKKRLLIIIASVLGAIAVLFGASFAIDKYYDKKNGEENSPIDYDFYPADYDENIYNDKEYIEKIENGFIYYTDFSNNITLGIERDNAAEYGDEVAFMVDYVYSIIEGDRAKYNGFFSDAYYENNDKHGEFTMQKLYDVNITKESSEQITENGNYTKYIFVVEYKIFKNNGTFRNDIGNGSKKQYITVTDRTGELEIDAVRTAKYK